MKTTNIRKTKIYESTKNIRTSICIPIFIGTHLHICTFLLICTFAHLSICTFAQDIHFSQFYNSPLTLNPALAGSFGGDMRVLTNYRNQWSGMYKTFAASYDAGLMKKRWKKGFLGVGVSIFSDKAGNSEMGTRQVNISVASTKSLDANNDVSVGLQAGFAQRSINANNLTWENQFNGKEFDPSRSSGELLNNSFSYGDFSTGINWNYGTGGGKYSITDNQFKVNTGVALFHVSQPNQSFSGTMEDKLHSKWVAYSNMLIGTKTNLAILPGVLFLRQGAAQEITTGVMLRYLLKEESRYTQFVNGAAMSFGGHYRVGDAIILSTQIEVSSYALGISYDINTSGMKSATAGHGGFEFSLRYVNPNPFGIRRTAKHAPSI